MAPGWSLGYLSYCFSVGKMWARWAVQEAMGEKLAQLTRRESHPDFHWGLPEGQAFPGFWARQACEEVALYYLWGQRKGAVGTHWGTVQQSRGGSSWWQVEPGFLGLNPGSSQTSYVNLGQLFNLSRPQFLLVKWGVDNTLIGSLWGFKRVNIC